MFVNNNTTDNFTSNKGSVVANRFKLNQDKEKYEKVDTILNWQFSLV